MSVISVQIELFGEVGIGADESVNISNEFGGNMDPQLFGKYLAFSFFCYNIMFSLLILVFHYNHFIAVVL